MWYSLGVFKVRLEAQREETAGGGVQGEAWREPARTDKRTASIGSRFPSIEQKTGDPVMQTHSRRVACTPLLAAALGEGRVRR
jgi:hypothetical protein